jgi:small subunit ribosomal protein S21
LIHLGNCDRPSINESLKGDKMTQVVVGENEGIESALRRFKRQVSKAGIFPDMKRQRHFETPIEKRKRKEIARRRKRRFNSGR